MLAKPFVSTISRMDTPAKNDYRFVSLLALIWVAWLLVVFLVFNAIHASYTTYIPEGIELSGITYHYSFGTGDDTAYATKEIWFWVSLKKTLFWASVSAVASLLLSFVAWSFLRPRSV